jgi:SAM-dependent methyltransferase
MQLTDTMVPRPPEYFFDEKYFAVNDEASARSAAVVVPHLIGLLPWVQSVVDVGCGTGNWLNEFRRQGIRDVLGVDGADARLVLSQLAPHEFVRVDLAQPFDCGGRRFDLALSLEVAHHLPASAAAAFVDGLSRLADVIVFSAAIPGQSGDWHVHERWPSYWAALFERRNFRCIDILRGKLWYDQRVEWCYAQNTLLLVNEAHRALVGDLERDHGGNCGPLDLVHPRCYDAAKRASAAMITRLMAEHGNGDIARFADVMPKGWIIAQWAATEKLRDNLEKNIQAEREDLADLRHRTHAVRIELEERNRALAAELAAIHQSTTWRAMRRVGRALAPYPRLRTSLRRAFNLTLGR